MIDVVLTHSPSLKRLIQGYSIITTSSVWKPLGDETTQQVCVTLNAFLSKEETIGEEGREFCDPIYTCERQFSVPSGTIIGDQMEAIYPWVEFDIVRAALIEKQRKEDVANPLIADTKIEDEQKREADLEKRKKCREEEKEAEISVAKKYFTEK